MFVILTVQKIKIYSTLLIHVSRRCKPWMRFLKRKGKNIRFLYFYV